MRILVTEDEADVSGVIARALERDGHSVSTAGSLEESRLALANGVDLRASRPWWDMGWGSH